MCAALGDGIFILIGPSFSLRCTSVATTWDLDLGYAWGAAMGKASIMASHPPSLNCMPDRRGHVYCSSVLRSIGEEFFNKGANVQLGPGVCLARVPVNGRNFEHVTFFINVLQPLALFIIRYLPIHA